MLQASIFISIANYRDTETPHTVLDLFAQAAQPHRLVVGVLSQVMPEADADCLAPEHPQVRQLCVLASQSLGACWARHRILSELRQDEAYVLQIDSHTRFSPGWDERFIQMLAQCPSSKPILTCHPIPYVPPRQLAELAIPVLRPKAFNEQGILAINSRSIPYAQRPAAPIASPFVGGGCIFAPARAFNEVPYDPHLYFQGEESTMSARLWTHGWDLFAPNDVLLYHDYTHDRGRPKHWRDNRDWTKLNQRSFERVRYLLSCTTPSDPESIMMMNEYGLGTARSIAEFERYAGINFRQARVR